MYLRCRLINSSALNTKSLALHPYPSHRIGISFQAIQSRSFSTNNEDKVKVETEQTPTLNQKEEPTDTTTATEGEESNTTPKFQFPWRHSAEVLPRVDPQSTDYNPFGPELWIPTTSWYKRMFIHAFSARSLGKSWFDIASGSWESELCTNFTWAFGRSISTLLGHVYHLPIDQLETSTKHENSEIIGVDFDSSTVEAASDTNPTTNETALNMLEQNVLNQYKHNNIVTTDSKYQIRLLTRPISATLVNMNIIPYPRELVNTKPELKGLYCRLLASAQTKNTSEYKNLRDTFLHAIGGKTRKDDIYKTTVISQVLIHCKEIFWVKDSASGKVIQGEESDVEKDVYHLVRFEIPVFSQANILLEGTPTSWIVSDFDDLLNGNVYY